MGWDYDPLGYASRTHESQPLDAPRGHQWILLWLIRRLPFSLPKSDV